MVDHPWGIVVSQLPGWMGRSGSKTLCRWFHEPPLVHQLRSSQPHLSLLQPLLQCSALYGLSLALCSCNPTVNHLTPVPCASCLLLQGQSPKSTQVPPRSAEWTHGEWHPLDMRFPSSPRMTGHFRRSKPPITDSTDQRIFVLPLFFSMPPAPASSLHGTPLPT